MKQAICKAATGFGQLRSLIAFFMSFFYFFFLGGTAFAELLPSQRVFAVCQESYQF